MRRIALLSLLAIFVTGCATVGPISTPPYYAPNPSAVLLKHQGELQATATASYGGETVTAAYALSRHLGLLASGSGTIHKAGDPNGNQYSCEAGIGWFDTSTRGHVLHEIYGAVGWGTGHNFLQSIFPGIPWNLRGC